MGSHQRLAVRGGSAPRARARDFSSDQGAEPQEYREYSEVRQRRAGGKDPASTRYGFRHGLLGALALLLVALTSAAVAQETVVAGVDGVRVPKRRKLVRPEYPPEAAAQGMRGIVILELIIGVDGGIDEVNVVRSVPPFDEPAVAAAQDWEYEPTTIDGIPVRVRLTVPISFLMKLPDITREEGIPELRQGAIPQVPPEATREAKVKAEITLMPSGEVAEAQIIEGDSPWSEAMILALRSWRFDANQIGDDIITFRAEARFIPEKRGKESRVPIKLSDMRRRPAELLAAVPDAPAAEPATEAPATEPLPEAEAASQSESPAATQPVAPAPSESPPTTAVEPPEIAPVDEAEPSGLPGEPAAETEMPAVAEAPAEEPAAEPQPEIPPPNAPVESPEQEPAQAPETPPAPTTPPDPAPDPMPTQLPAAEESETAASAPPEAASEIETTPVESGPPEMIQQPATEVMTLAPNAAPAPPPRSDEPGVSSIQGVFLGAGLPDLTSGRRPVVPPFARMDGLVGDVTIAFAITPAGTTVVRDVQGPEVFQIAAREAVQSWFFVRETAERLFATAGFSYDAEGASAQVELDSDPQ